MGSHVERQNGPPLSDKQQAVDDGVTRAKAAKGQLGIKKMNGQVPVGAHDRP
jgi:hypothetical protein